MASWKKLVTYNTGDTITVSNPSADTHAVNKGYVDTAVEGENTWNRVNTTLSPNTTGDNLANLGTISSGDITTTGDFLVSSSDPTITIKRSNNTAYAGHIDFTNSADTLGWQLGTNILVGDGTGFEINYLGSNKLSITTGGNTTVSGNLVVSGDLTISGSTTTVNTATITVEDPLIKLASGNSSADTVDIGFYGLCDPSGSQDTYTGLIRDASDGEYHLFDLLQAEPTTTMDTSGTGFDHADLTVGALTVDDTLGVTGEVTLSSHLNMGDADRIKLGNTAGDFELYHIGGSINVISGGGGLVLQTDDTSYGIQMGTYTDGETMFKALKNGAVTLYHDNAVKFATTSSGISVTGTVDATNYKIGGGQGSDGQVLTSTGSGVAWEAATGSGHWDRDTSGSFPVLSQGTDNDIVKVTSADGANRNTYIFEVVNLDQTADQGYGAKIQSGNNATDSTLVIRDRAGNDTAKFKGDRSSNFYGTTIVDNSTEAIFRVKRSTRYGEIAQNSSGTVFTGLQADGDTGFQISSYGASLICPLGVGTSDASHRTLILGGRPSNTNHVTLGFDSGGTYRGAWDYSASDGSMKWWSYDSGWTEKLAIYSSGATTFSGDVTISNSIPLIYMNDTSGNDNNQIIFQAGGGNIFRIGTDITTNNGTQAFEITNGGGNSAWLSINSSGDATFAGDVLLSGNNKFGSTSSYIRANPTASDLVIYSGNSAAGDIQIFGRRYIYFFDIDASNATRFTFDTSNGNATFTGAVTIDPSGTTEQLLQITNTKTGDWNEMVNVLSPSANNGIHTAGIYFGKARSTDNLGHLTFIPNATAYQSEVAIGIWGRNDLLKLRGDGQALFAGKIGVGGSPTGHIEANQSENTVVDTSATDSQRDKGASIVAYNQSTTSNSFAQFVLRTGDSGTGAIRLLGLRSGSDNSEFQIHKDEVKRFIMDSNYTTFTNTKPVMFPGNGTASSYITIGGGTTMASQIRMIYDDGGLRLMSYGADTSTKGKYRFDALTSNGTEATVLQTDTNGNATFAGNVGVAGAAGGHALTVTGEVKFNLSGSANMTINTVGGDAAYYMTDSDGTIQVNVDTEGNSYFKGGNFAIGHSSPTDLLHVKATSGNVYGIIETTGTNQAAGLYLIGNGNDESRLYFGNESSSNIGRVVYVHGDNSMRFTTNSSEAMRLDSSQDATFYGNVTIQKELTVNKNATDSYQQPIRFMQHSSWSDIRMGAQGNEWWIGSNVTRSSDGFTQSGAAYKGSAINFFNGDLYFNTGIAVGGTQAYTSRSVTFESNGNVAFNSSFVGQTKNQASATEFRVQNNTGNTSSNAMITAWTGGASSGDPLFKLTTEATTWSIGLDNSDSDYFKISASGTVGSSTSLTLGGTSAVFAGTITAGGLIRTSYSGAAGIEVDSSNGGDAYIDLANASVNWTIRNTDNLILQHEGTEKWKIDSAGTVTHTGVVISSSYFQSNSTGIAFRVGSLAYDTLYYASNNRIGFDGATTQRFECTTASFTGNITATSFAGKLVGNLTGAPDATIWCVSNDYTNWGIFYDEGSPDTIDFRASGSTKAHISLDDGDFYGRYMDAERFRDRDNTAYYLEPAATSHLYALNVYGSMKITAVANASYGWEYHTTETTRAFHIYSGGTGDNGYFGGIDHGSGTTNFAIHSDASHNSYMCVTGAKFGLGTGSPEVKLDVHSHGTEVAAVFGMADDGTVFVTTRTAETQNNYGAYAFMVGSAAVDGVGSANTTAFISSAVVNSGGVLKGNLKFHTNYGDDLGNPVFDLNESGHAQFVSKTNYNRIFIGSTSAAHSGSIYAYANTIGFLDVNGHWAYEITTAGNHTWKTSNVVKMTLANNGNLTTTGNFIIAADSTGSDQRLKLGASADLQLWHNATDSVVANFNTGKMYLWNYADADTYIGSWDTTQLILGEESATFEGSTVNFGGSSRGKITNYGSHDMQLHSVYGISFDADYNWDSATMHGITSTDHNNNAGVGMSINSYNDITFHMDTDSSDTNSYFRIKGNTTGSGASSFWVRHDGEVWCALNITADAFNTGDINMKNDKGDFTLSEEADFIKIRNNKTGKFYRLVMEEITDD